MSLSMLFAVWIGKLIYFCSRSLKIGGGSAAPGYFALKICPNLIEKIVTQIPRCVIITGTNGKTTTARMLGHFAKANNVKILRNATGSNLERGIASALVAEANVFGQITDVDLAIWETDEAAFNKATTKLNPDIIVFLNAFRDQLDRYGEVDKIVALWRETLQNLNKKTVILVNGGDPSTKSLSDYFPGKTQSFGIRRHVIKHESTESFQQACFFNFEAKDVLIHGLTSTSFQLKNQKTLTCVKLPIPGIYHIYDFLAAYACTYHLGFSQKKTLMSLKHYSPAFGRVERFRLPPRGRERGMEGWIWLIKNPVGATLVLETIVPELSGTDTLIFALNDNFADGKDVSWIWDADFEVLQNLFREKLRKLKIYASGTRAEDLAVRLKYAGIPAQNITIEPSLEKAFEEAKGGLGRRLFILPTYTALLELQSLLTEQKIKRHYWEEN